MADRWHDYALLDWRPYATNDSVRLLEEGRDYLGPHAAAFSRRCGSLRFVLCAVAVVAVLSAAVAQHTSSGRLAAHHAVPVAAPPSDARLPIGEAKWVTQIAPKASNASANTSESAEHIVDNSTVAEEASNASANTSESAEHIVDNSTVAEEVKPQSPASNASADTSTSAEHIAFNGTVGEAAEEASNASANSNASPEHIAGNGTVSAVSDMAENSSSSSQDPIAGFAGELSEAPQSHLMVSIWQGRDKQPTEMVEGKRRSFVGGVPEWEVVCNSSVVVRSSPSVLSEGFSSLPKGTVLSGEPKRGWLSLRSLPGYVRISLHGNNLLKERLVSYTVTEPGACSKAGLFFITDASVCVVAAKALGFDSSGMQVTAPIEIDECLWLSPTSKQSAADHPEFVSICSSHKYRSSVGSSIANEDSETTTLEDTTSQLLVTTTTSLDILVLPTHSPTRTPSAVVAQPTSTTSANSDNSSGTNSSTTSFTITNTTTTTQAEPSLFCFSVVKADTYEPELVRAQFHKAAGIFACDEFALLCDVEEGADSSSLLPIKPIAIPKIQTGVSQDGTAANTQTFMQAWSALLNDGRPLKFDWSAKVDPDAVIVPERLRQHIEPYNTKSAFIQNCNVFPDSPNFPMMYGATELISRRAMEVYREGKRRCRDELQWQAWGEDLFMGHCMELLGVEPVQDFKVLSDGRCLGVNCQDSQAAAFHPFKDTASWMACWEQAMT